MRMNSRHLNDAWHSSKSTDKNCHGSINSPQEEPDEKQLVLSETEGSARLSAFGGNHI